MQKFIAFISKIIVFTFELGHELSCWFGHLCPRWISRVLILQTLASIWLSPPYLHCISYFSTCPTRVTLVPEPTLKIRLRVSILLRMCAPWKGFSGVLVYLEPSPIGKHCFKILHKKTEPFVHSYDYFLFIFGQVVFYYQNCSSVYSCLNAIVVRK